MSAERKVPLHDERPAGEATCGFGPNLCGEPATRHVLWLKDTENILCCDKHFHEYVVPRITPGECDSHAFGGVCTMPGTRWKFSEPPHEGYCFFDLPESIDLTEELELVGAAADPERSNR